MKRIVTLCAAFASLAAVVCSCGQSNSKVTETASIELTEEFSSLPVLTLTAIDTLQSFNDAYPIKVEKAGDKLIVLFSMMEDTMIRVYDVASKTKLASLGIKGNGPQDVISPEFFHNRRVQGDSCITLYDPNLGCTLNISLTDYTLNKEPLNKALGGQSSINYFDDSAVSYYIRSSDYMFKISQFEPENEKLVEYPFTLTDENETKTSNLPGNVFAQIIYANKSKGRILSSLFYFDAYYLFDFEGNFLKEFHLATEDFDMNKAVTRYFNRDRSESLMNSYGYATDHYCYFRRIKEKHNFEQKSSITIGDEIIKVDWDGNPVAIIKLPNESASFCVDSNENIIAITKTTDDAESEIYSIIKYRF